MSAKALVTSMLLLAVASGSNAAAQTWRQLLDTAFVLLQTGDQEQALRFAEKAVAPALHKDGDTSLPAAIHRYATMNHRLRRFAAAESLYQCALAAWQKAQHPNRSEEVKTIHNLGSLYSEIGEPIKAEEYLRRAIAIKETIPGMQGKLSLAVSMSNLAILYREKGILDESLVMLEQSLRIREQYLDSTDPVLASSYNNTGTAYYAIRDLPRAEDYFQRAVSLGSSQRDRGALAGYRSNLGIVKMELFRYAEAESLLLEALGEFTRLKPQSVPALIMVHHDLGLVKYYQADYDRAIVYHQLALALGDSARCSPLAHDYVGSVLGMANCYRRQGKYTMADSLFRRGVELKRQSVYAGDWELADALDAFGQSKWAQRQYAEALALLESALNTILLGSQRFSPVLSEFEALRYSVMVRTHRDHLLTCYSEARVHVPALHRLALRGILAGKGTVTDAVFERHSHLQRDSAMRQSYNAYRRTLLALSTYASRELRQGAKQYPRQAIDSLAARADSMEQALARQSVAFRNQMRLTEADPDSIIACLPPRSVLMEFLKTDSLDVLTGSHVPRYVAAILSADRSPEIVSLGPASAIDKAIEEWRRHVAPGNQPATAECLQRPHTLQQLSERLTNLVWQPLQQFAKRGSLLLLAPDGALNLVPLGAILLPDGRYLIEKYPVHYLSAARDLLRLRTPTRNGVGLLAVGNPDYDASPGERRAALGPSEAPAPLGVAIAQSAAPSPGPVMRAMGDLSLPRLPGTGIEINATIAAWRVRYPGEPASSLADASATEENLKRMSPGRRVLHIATHGYVLSQHAEDRAGTLNATEHPLLRSGLFLAGAGFRPREVPTDSSMEDGILTALEVSALDLRGTELVVLSACESGLGRVEQGEGVYGLRRAFQLAGARTIVSSLWPVPDRETMTFMKELYYGRAITYPEILQRAAMRTIQEQRRRGRPDVPSLWGGFIATGDWRIR
jgi:CHAT domain-containing protein